MKSRLNTIFVLIIGGTSCLSQSFVNLNFESAIIKPDTSSIYYPYAVFASNAIPRWTAFIYGVSQADIIYNTISLGAASVNLEGTNSGFPTIQGNFFIYLQGDSGGQGVSAGIGQTGQIPLNALSLIFWGATGQPHNSAFVSFAGNLLPLNQIGGTASYNIYAADISAYAGQTGQLLFTAPSAGGMYLDNIQFSSSAVPEPGAIGLFALGGLFLGWRRWNARSS